MWRYLIVLLAVILSLLFLILPTVPLGVPGEWVWPRQTLPETMAEAVDRLMIPLLLGVTVIGMARAVDRRIARSSRPARWFFLACLAMLSFAWLNGARQAAASPHREIRPLWVLYDKYASGYFFEAAFHIQSREELLSTYEDRMAKGDVLHEGTHPPGLFLLSWWALKATEASPAVAWLAEMTQSAESVRLFRTVEKEARLASPLSQTQFSALCLLSFVSTMFGALTVVPVFGLVQRFYGPGTGWRAACLMITVPSLSVFAPRSDIVYACSGMWMLWLIVSTLCQRSTMGACLLGVLAALVTFVSLTISLAHIPIVVAGAVFSVLICVGDHRLSLRHVFLGVTVMVGAFLIVTQVWAMNTDCDLLQIWRMNLANHAGFYHQSPRTWWKWFLVNPLELSFSIGLPLSFISVVTILSELKSALIQPESPGKKLAKQRNAASKGGSVSGANVDPPRQQPGIFRRLMFSLMATWALLWLSGKNMGEAARLWSFLTPWFIIAAVPSLATSRTRIGEETQLLQADTTPRYYPGSSELWLFLLGAQLVVSTLTTGRVSGYLEL